MAPKSTAVRKPAFDPIQFVQDLISAGAVLNDKAAKEAWGTLEGHTGAFGNEGKLLTELLQIAPVNLDRFHWFGKYILSYLAKEGAFPDSIWQHVSKAALDSRIELKLPVDKVRPILATLNDSDFCHALLKDPELYSPELDATCLRCLTEKLNGYGVNTKQRLFAMLPECFRAAHWDKVLKHVVNLDAQDNLPDFFEVVGPSFKDSEKEKVVRDLLGAMTPKGDGYDPNRLKWLYAAIKKNVPAFLQGPVISELKAKTEALFTAEQAVDPVEAFLNGKISWQEAQFAKSNPEEYKKHQSGGWRESQQDWAMSFGFGPPPWYLRRRF